MSPTQIHYHMDHSSFLPLLIYNLPLQKWKPHSHHQPSIYLISFLAYVYDGFRINPYPQKKQLYQLEYNACVAFRLHLFPKVELYFSPFISPPSAWLFYTFVMHLDFFFPHSAFHLSPPTFETF